jgi:uncharacterized protein YraI
LQTPRAVVVAENGLNLRSGPGINYDVISYLSTDTVLEIWGRDASKRWIQVSPVDSLTTGWVSANYVAIETNLTSIPVVEVPPLPSPSPTYTPTSAVEYKYESGPRLFEPRPFASVPIGEAVRFSWEEFPLDEYEYYSIRVLRDDFAPENACIHFQTRDPEVILELNCPAGAYTWSVAIALDLSEGNRLEWQENSRKNELNPLGIGMPHPGRPSDGGSDEGNDAQPILAPDG